MKVAYIIPIMKKVDKKVSRCRFFLYFCTTVDFDGVFKNLQIMKKSKRQPLVYSRLLVDRIDAQIILAKKDYSSFVDTSTAISESIRHYEIALDDCNKLVSHLESMISLLNDLKPLPF